MLKRQPRPYIPDYVNKSQPYILEIENETRKYVLAAKSRFDLDEWCWAIHSHIETLSLNQNLKKNQALMIQKEKQVAKSDQNQIMRTLYKLKLEVNQTASVNLLLQNQALQTKLLEYIKDAFIEELLAGITYYMTLCDKVDLRRNAE